MDNKLNIKSNEENRLSYEKLKIILDNAFDEIFVYDNNYRVVYVNRACERHYGLKAEDIIGKTFWELLDNECWYPSVLPTIYKEKRSMTIEQTSYLGETLITTGVPIFDKDGKIELVVMSVRDQMQDIALTRAKLEKDYANGKNIDQLKSQDTIVESEKNEIISRSIIMKELLQLCERVAKVDSTIMIRGESGTGKSILAKYIHQKSNRKDRPLLTINCAAIPEDLLESELFGYVKGAFTGASEAGKVGLIELADMGTLFLDEVGELSPRLQAKLLHVIQEKQFIPIGGREIKIVDIRIITATNRDLLEMVENKKFREDLYWRLNVIEVEVSPLRERPEDIVALSNYFLNKFNKKYHYTCALSKECSDFFMKYHWPGNVRQLENIIERLVVTSTKPTISANDLPKILHVKTNADYDKRLPESFDLAKEEFEQNIIINAYKKYRSSRKVAEALNITQTRASKLLRKYCSHIIE